MLVQLYVFNICFQTEVLIGPIGQIPMGPGEELRGFQSKAWGLTISTAIAFRQKVHLRIELNFSNVGQMKDKTCQMGRPG